MVIVITYWSEN